MGLFKVNNENDLLRLEGYLKSRVYHEATYPHYDKNKNFMVGMGKNSGLIWCGKDKKLMWAVKDLVEKYASPYSD